MEASTSRFGLFPPLNKLIVDVVRAMEQGRSPLVLAGRAEHIPHIETALAGRVRNIV